MRAVINKCFGGFGLSHAAIKALIGRCSHVELVEPSEYYGGPGSTYYEANKARRRIDPNEWRKSYERDLARAGKDSFSPLFYDGKVVCDEHSGAANRSCPALIEVVERMGEASYGECAKLAVVEVPDGVEWEIDEYDGREHIAESYRTWS